MSLLFFAERFPVEKTKHQIVGGKSKDRQLRLSCIQTASGCNADGGRGRNGELLGQTVTFRSVIQRQDAIGAFRHKEDTQPDGGSEGAVALSAVLDLSAHLHPDLLLGIGLQTVDRILQKTLCRDLGKIRHLLCGKNRDQEGCQQNGDKDFFHFSSSVFFFLRDVRFFLAGAVFLGLSVSSSSGSSKV